MSIVTQNYCNFKQLSINLCLYTGGSKLQITLTDHESDDSLFLLTAAPLAKSHQPVTIPVPKIITIHQAAMLIRGAYEETNNQLQGLC